MTAKPKAAIPIGTPKAEVVRSNRIGSAKLFRHFQPDFNAADLTGSRGTRRERTTPRVTHTSRLLLWRSRSAAR